jgi:uncharacterized protein YndB with AHSA1/START domain
MTPKFQVHLKIRKPVAEVFAAVVDAQKLSSYFVRTASGPLAAGATVEWSFVEAPRPIPVHVREVDPDARIIFEWPAAGGYETCVEMEFVPLDGANTMVKISEHGWREDAEGVKGSYDNAGGWMHMLCCLKARLEYDINLRAGGAF